MHRTTAFSRSDHLPLGSRFGRLATSPEPPSPARPFGLRLAEPPRQITDVDTGAFRYDHDRQIGTMYDADTATVIELARHTDGQTGTVTNTDGHQGRDSDTDHRED